MTEALKKLDTALIHRVAVERDESAFAELMERHAPKITGYLTRKFAHQLGEPEIEEVVNRSALKVWEKIGQFNSSKPFGPWFLTIAHNAALDMLKSEERRPVLSELEFDPEDIVANVDVESEGSPAVNWRVEQLEQIIDFELRGFEQALARADVAAGEASDTQLLMRLHNKTKSVVQVTRSKVWKKIRNIISERESARVPKKVIQ